MNFLKVLGAIVILTAAVNFWFFVGNRSAAQDASLKDGTIWKIETISISERGLKIFFSSYHPDQVKQVEMSADIPTTHNDFALMEQSKTGDWFKLKSDGSTYSRSSVWERDEEDYLHFIPIDNVSAKGERK